MNILNQYSYPLIAFVVFAVVFVALRHRANWRAVLVAELAAIAVFTAGFLVLRPGNSDVDTLQAAEALLSNNRPTFVEFFSNFCTACLVLHPAVDDLVSEIEGEFNILRVNIHSPEGRALRERYAFSFTPEFIVFDADGNEIWRDHIPPPQTILDTAR